MNFASNLLFLWSSCSLVSANKECSFFLLNSNLVFIAVVRLKLWCSGFDSTRFHKFFLGICPFFMFSKFVKLSRYCQFKYPNFGVQNNTQLEIFKSLKIYIVVLYRFDNTFSKNFIEFFNFVFNCRFCFVFLVVFNFLYNDPV